MKNVILGIWNWLSVRNIVRSIPFIIGGVFGLMIVHFLFTGDWRFYRTDPALQFDKSSQIQIVVDELDGMSASEREQFCLKHTPTLAGTEIEDWQIPDFCKTVAEQWSEIRQALLNSKP